MYFTVHDYISYLPNSIIISMHSGRVRGVVSCSVVGVLHQIFKLIVGHPPAACVMVSGFVTMIICMEEPCRD